MKLYEKPVVELIDDVAEIVCADGSNTNGNDNTNNTTEPTTVGLCPYGRQFASSGVDACQSCSATDGRDPNNTERQYYAADYKGCPFGFPEK